MLDCPYSCQEGRVVHVSSVDLRQIAIIILVLDTGAELSGIVGLMHSEAPES